MKTNYMSKMVLFLIVTFSFSAKIFSQDTFSIVAVDTVTGEIGSAGASCIAGSFILIDVIEGIGGIHTQALLRREIKVIRLRKSLTNSDEERLFS